MATHFKTPKKITNCLKTKFYIIYFTLTGGKEIVAKYKLKYFYHHVIFSLYNKLDIVLRNFTTNDSCRSHGLLFRSKIITEIKSI